jgi:hypothetical protein
MQENITVLQKSRGVINMPNIGQKTNKGYMNKNTKLKVNFTIDPMVYQHFSKFTEKNLQPKSWVIEFYMKEYIKNNGISNLT